MNLGIKDTGFGLLAWTKAGGYYLGACYSFLFLHILTTTSSPDHHPQHAYIIYLTDTGGSQLIADGKIKLKATGEISSFTEKGIKFDDGSELEADVVVFATGYVSLYLTVHSMSSLRPHPRCLAFTLVLILTPHPRQLPLFFTPLL